MLANSVMMQCLLIHKHTQFRLQAAVWAVNDVGEIPHAPCTPHRNSRGQSLSFNMRCCRCRGGGGGGSSCLTQRQLRGFLSACVQKTCYRCRAGDIQNQKTSRRRLWMSVRIWKWCHRCRTTSVLIQNKRHRSCAASVWFRNLCQCCPVTSAVEHENGCGASWGTEVLFILSGPSIK